MDPALTEAGRKACLSYWYPILLERAPSIPMPRTDIIRTTLDLLSIFDSGMPGPDEFSAFINLLRDSARGMGGGKPVFLRTGHTSGKFDWRKTCFVENVEKIAGNVLNLVQFSEEADLLGLPTDVWVVREFLDTETYFTAFGDGLPVSRERRYFVDGGQVMCHHPYWPEEALIGFSTDPHWKEKLAVINKQGDPEVEYLSALAREAGAALGGKWSIDFLHTNKGWYLTDCAPAEVSFHWLGCPNGVDQ